MFSVDEILLFTVLDKHQEEKILHILLTTKINVRLPRCCVLNSERHVK